MIKYETYCICRSSLFVDTIQPVKHLDIIQLAHGMTGRLLNRWVDEIHNQAGLQTGDGQLYNAHRLTIKSITFKTIHWTLYNLLSLRDKKTYYLLTILDTILDFPELPGTTRLHHCLLEPVIAYKKPHLTHTYITLQPLEIWKYFCC